MYLNRIAKLLGSLLGLRRQPAYCPVPRSKSLRCLLLAAVALSGRGVEASVLVSGDVTPSDNPFTLNINEGLPSAGNKIDPFADPDPLIAPSVQTLWEGIYDPVNDTNINKNIIVGKTATGILQISQVELRDMNLVIGDSAAPPNGGTGPLQYGIGTVYITGMGSLFNNDPYRLPPGLPANFSSKNPRLSAAPQDGLDGPEDGFDLYVGRTGFGTLRIDAFGRAEIEDSVLVGDSIGSIGNLIIDGFNSSLINGGSFDFGPTDSDTVHMTIIGRQGTGNLTISNAATMVTQVFAASGGANQGVVGAALGSLPYTLQTSGGGVLPAGGNGTATITGAGSRWSISGSLQIGGFDNGTGGGGILTTGGDLEGDDVEYGSQAGRGTLQVNEGGWVQIQNAIGASTGGGQETALVMAIGRFGTVSLNGGTIQIGGPEGGQQDDPTPDSVAVVNDGIITGTGRINTGVFRNRYFGKVRVELGQSLVIDSSSEFNTSGGQTPAEPLVNYGTIEVIGNSQQQAQLEFVRSPQESDTSTAVRPFVNLPLTDPVATSPAFTGGLISGQYSTMRFGSGLENRSLVAFTAGTNNVSGRVVNLLPEPPSGGSGTDPLPVTQMLVSGAGTTAIFSDDLAFGSGALLNLTDGGKVVVLNEHSFTLAGDLSMTLSYTHPSLITVSGDVGIGQGTTELSLDLASDALNALSHGDAFQLISFGGEIGGVDVSDPLSPIPDLAVSPLFSAVHVSPNIFNLYGLVTQIQFAHEGVYAVFLDPTQVGPAPGGAVGPDFNGDGVIDLDDFAIWQAHVGITSGASVLDGDADGDGDVDGADFLFWQRNVGQPMPWTGSGSGLGGGSEMASVPEPTSLVMLACCGSLALGLVRRRLR